MRKRMYGLAVPVIVLALLLAGCFLFAPKQASRAVRDVPAPTSALTHLEIYAPLIGEWYTALAEGWDEERLAEAGMSPLMASCGEAPLESVGYAVIDLDSDGVPELLLASLDGDAFFGKMVFQLYTLDERNEPMRLFTGTGDNRWYYAGGIRFANLGETAFDCDFVTTLKLEGREMVDMTYTTDPAEYVQLPLMPLSQWVALAPEEADAP